jgi:hypothetical protein
MRFVSRPLALPRDEPKGRRVPGKLRSSESTWTRSVPISQSKQPLVRFAGLPCTTPDSSRRCSGHLWPDDARPQDERKPSSLDLKNLRLLYRSSRGRRCRPPGPLTAVQQGWTGRKPGSLLQSIQTRTGRSVVSPRRRSLPAPEGALAAAGRLGSRRGLHGQWRLVTAGQTLVRFCSTSEACGLPTYRPTG